MKHVLYKVDGKIFATQKAVAYYHNFKLTTFRSRIERAGGINTIDRISINNVTVEILKEFFN